MSRHERVQRVLDSGIVAIIRASSSDELVDVARALYDGGIDVIEVTLTVPGALQTISDVRRDLGDSILLGAGTVLDPESARAAILAGAQFLVAPSLNLDVIRLSHRYATPVMPGVLTPTEVIAAWEAGAEILKVFPADVGGPAYLKALHGPFPDVRLLPTGGVNLDTAESFLNAGACAIGLGSALVEKAAVESRDFDRIRDLASQYVRIVKSCRTIGE
jgi:2-dehydro-3-deoxyphosphogluconate aldolase/(4S)-4-hydroxy-2-oxoglutarate aldolase